MASLPLAAFQRLNAQSSNLNRSVIYARATIIKVCTIIVKHMYKCFNKFGNKINVNAFECLGIAILVTYTRPGWFEHLY